MKLEIALVGPSGVVGREVLGALWEAEFPVEQLTVLGPERSLGQEVDYGDESLEVELAGPEAFRGKAVVILATPAEVSATLAKEAQAAGAWVVDLSEAFHGDAAVPMVLPGVNDAVLERPLKGRIVTLPSAVTSALAFLAVALEGLGITSMWVTALLGASSAGARGIRDLERETADLLSGREPEPGSFPHRLALNFIPHVGRFAAGSSDTSEELRWASELARLWATRGTAAPVVAGTAVQVPTFFGHGLSLLLEASRPLPLEDVRAALGRSSAIKLLDDPANRIYPMPMLVTADDTLHVGRLRTVPGRPSSVALFAAIDNASRGAATGAVELVELLKRRL